MRKTDSRNMLAAIVTSMVLLANSSQASLIVNLNPADAVHDSLTDGTSQNVSTTAGGPGMNQSLGLTMNVTFTPNAADISNVSNAISLMEIGGNANGTGLYLLGGEVHFLSKMGGVAGDVVASFNDLDFSSGNNMVGLKSSYGQLVAGTEYSLAAVYDPINTSSLRLALQPVGGALQTEDYIFTGRGGKTNWVGNGTVTTSIAPSNAGGGTSNATNPSHPFNENLMPALSGSLDQSLMWNSTASVIPEPATLGLLLSGLLGVVGLRRLIWR